MTWIKNLYAILAALLLWVGSTQAQSITITAPNGGQVISGCTNYNITWTASGTSNNYSIDYSLDNGTSWTSLTSFYFTTGGSFTWAVPNVSSTNCLVRVYDSNAPAVTDVSDAVFTINGPLIIQTPNGGENLVAGTNHLVQWLASGTSNVYTLDYSTDNGATWTAIFTSTSNATGQYNWTVPNVNTTQGRIRIRDVNNQPCMTDISNTAFNIISTITVTAPNGGQTMAATVGPNGGTHVMNNTTVVSNTGNFYDDGGLASNYAVSTSYVKTFYPDNPYLKLQFVFTHFQLGNSGDYLRVYDGPSTSDPLIGTYSTGVVTPLTITSTHKTGALTFLWNSDLATVGTGFRSYFTSTGGATYPVTWSYTGTSGVFDLEYSTNGGVSWLSILNGYPSTTGTFDWPVPNHTTTSARFRVKDNVNGNIFDASNANFTINPAVGRILVLSPDGGESYFAGTNTSIQWRSGFLTSGNVDIDYSTNNGSTWTSVVANTPNDGSQSWTLPNTPSTQCLIRISESGAPAVTDVSDAVFTILPHVTVTSPNGAESLLGCNAHTILWNHGGTSGFFDIELSTDNGSTWSAIVTNLNRPSTPASYAWTVNNVGSTNCRIRVLDRITPTKVDQSDAVFTINQTANVAVSSPNGGESWVSGGTYPIVYVTGGGVTNVRIDYSLDNGSTWLSISPNTSGNIYNWTVPNTPSTQALIRVMDVANSCNYDVSNAVFNIVSNVQVTVPNGGQTYQASGGPNGGSYIIQSAPTVVITTGNLYDPGGPTGIYGINESYVRTFIPFNPTAKLRIIFSEFSVQSGDYLRVYDGESTSAPVIGTYTSSNVPTTITSSDVGGGLTFEWFSNSAGSSNGFRASITSYKATNPNVSWNITGTSGLFNLHYSTDAGVTWISVTDYLNATAAAGFSWAVPNTPTSTARVRVMDAGNGNIVDMSDANFSITPASPVYLQYSPNGSETWYGCQSRTVQWRSAFTSSSFVNLEYTTNNGTTWLPIASNTFNDGTESWTLPNINSTNCRVRVTDVANALNTDQSDNVFNIRPCLTVQAPNGGETITGCTSYNVLWENGGTSNFFDLDYSTDAGTSWNGIVTNLNRTGTNVSYAWSVPNLNSTQGLLRVTDTNFPTRRDTSNAVFTFSPTLNVQVTIPNGGEQYVALQTYPVHFALQGGVTAVRIEYSTNNGTSWTTVTSSTSTSPYNWTVPNTPGTQCLLRITDTSNPCNFDVSNAHFTILSSITVLGPNGGEVVEASAGLPSGSFTLSNFTEATVSTCNIYDPGGPSGIYGINENYIKTFRPFNPKAKLRMQFQAFDVQSGDYLRVHNGPSSSDAIIGTYSGSSLPSDITSTHFTGALTLVWVSNISGSSAGFKSTMTNIHPNNQTISWNYTGTTGRFDLEYSTNNGASWSRIVTEYSNATNTFQWPAPNTPTTQARIRVLDNGNGSIVDQSDNAFTIGLTPPVYLVYSPVGGEVWYAGTSRQVQWLSAFATNPNVQIQFSTNNGGAWTTISALTVNDGTETWNIGNTPSTQALVRVFDPAQSVRGDTSDAVFTIRPYITVQSPNGGETLTGCGTHNITWENGGTSNFFDLDYSTDNGATWTSIITNLNRTGTSVNYTWTVPNIVSNQCLIRIKDTNDPLRVDQSDAAFTISPSLNVQVNSPNGGEIFVAGATYPINYTLQGGVTSVRIEYSTNNGASWITVTSNTSTNPYNWTIPNVSSTQALIRVTDFANACNWDQSNAVFTLLSEITVLTPNGAEVVEASGGVPSTFYNLTDFVEVTVTSCNVYDPGGISGVYGINESYQKTFRPFNPESKLRMQFQNFDVQSGDYLRVYNGPTTSDPLMGTYSGSSLPPDLTSTHKHGALTLVWFSNISGSTAGFRASITSVHPNNQVISWNYTGTSGRFNLEYSTNNGGTWARIISDYASPTNNFTWSAPNIPTTQARVRVVDYNNSAILDQSNNTFTIDSTKATYVVTSPDGGEIWYAGGTRNITWLSAFGYNPNVSLQYSTNNGGAWTNISTLTLNDGTESWLLPNTPTTQALVRVFDPSRPGWKDQSDAVFTIRPYLTVQSPNGGETLVGCTTHNILWENGASSNFFDIDYSTDNGATWTSIVTNLNRTGTSVSYSWSVPNLISSQCKIRITDTNDPTRTDISDAVFTINPTTNVTVVAPNGGETWVAGSVYQITYALQGGVTSVRLEYSTNNGTSWTTITSGASGSSYAWTVPNVNSCQSLIRITDVSNPCNFDISASTFCILSTIQVLNPNGPDTLKASVTQNGGSYLLVSASNVEVNTANIYDPGGPTGVYGINESYFRTFYPDNPTHKLRLSFGEFNVQSGDYIRVYNGPSTGFPVLGTFSGTSLPPSVISTHLTGALTLEWFSNISGSTAGFSAYLVNVGADNESVDYNVVGTSGKYHMEYSTNAGTTWTRVMSSYINGSYHFDWPVPNFPTSTGRFRVVDENNSLVNDMSDNNLVILPGDPELVLWSPNGGESYFAGTNASIEWGSIFLSSGSVRLDYSTNNGSTWNLITTATTDDGQFTWTLPSTPSTQCLVRISDFGNAATADESNAVFTILPHVTVTSPNGGETFTGCNTHNITWNHGGTSGFFDLSYSTDNGATWNVITTNLNRPSTPASYAWSLPNLGSATALIQIVDRNDPSKVDVSNAVFTMAPTQDVQINSPNGSENWVAGTQQNIVYTILGGVTSIRLEYSIDGGTTWTTITSSTTGGSYLWTIPNLPSTNCLIRGTDVGNSCKSDASNAVFNIISTITTASPNGGESWQGQVGTPGGIFLMNTSTNVVTSTANFYDSGGESSQYGINEFMTRTFFPDVSLNKTRVTFSAFDVPSGDILRVYDGPSTGFPLLGSYSGSALPPMLTSTHSSGALTFYFTSNTTTNGNGWTAYISNVGTPTNNITWSTVGTSGEVDIEYSTNTGLTWTTIIRDYPANPPLYVWQVPNTPTANALVRVRDHNNASILDQSNAVFAINPANTHMYAPNGGEVLYSGISYDIKWDAPTYLSTNVQIEYSIDGGANWNLVTAFTFNDGVYTWTPPQTTVTLPNCKIRVSESGNTILNDQSDASFTLNPAIRITSPNSNVGNWRGCTQATISWVAGASTNYIIELSTDSMTTWTSVESNYFNSNSTVNYTWSIPNTPSTECFIRVTDRNNPTRYDVSDSSFTITPTITVLTPTFGTQVQAGSTQSITWATTVSSNFYDIDYSTNGGATWVNIVTNYFTTSSNYAWTVPSAFSSNCLVRVRDNTNTCKEGISLYPFTIQSGVPAITITRPNGGNNYAGCTTDTIRWNMGATSGFFNIDYSTNAGASWVAVANNYNSATGVYLWSVPNVNSSQCLVRVTDAADPGKWDVSNQTFNITATVTASITPSGPTTICQGDTVVLTSSSPVGNIWAPGGQTGPSIPVTTSGNYTVTVTQAGCTATSLPITVTVNPNPATPVISPAGPSTICAGTSIVLSSSSPSGNVWSTAATTQAVSVSTAGAYTVTTTDQNGCSATSTPSIVNVTPAPPTPVLGSNSPVSIGGTINLTASTISGASYNWTGPNGFSSTLQNPSITNATLAMGGTYTATVTVGGCVSLPGTVNVSVTTSGGAVNVAGTVMSEIGSPVRTVTLVRSGTGANDTVVTTTNGQFSFGMTAGSPYTVTPSKADDAVTNNGVTTLDLILMRRHILNVDTLGSAYKILAADVNFSNSVTTLDLVLTRTVILQTNLTFPNGALWTFVNSAYLFANPISPWPYEAIRNYPAAVAASGQDFIAVKLGDVNNTWDPNVAKMGYTGRLGFDMGDLSAQAGEEISVPVRVRNFEEIAGYQFTMNWNPAHLSFVGVEQGVLNGHFGESRVAEGMLTTSWDDEMGAAVSLEDGSVVFTLRFRVLEGEERQTPVYISSSMAEAEGYNNNLERLMLETRPARVQVSEMGGEAESGEGFALFQNYPNPFDDKTEISFRVPEAASVTLDIYNVEGKRIQSFEGQYQPGKHTVLWDGKDSEGQAQVSGVYFVRMSAGEYSATRRMVYSRK